MVKFEYGTVEDIIDPLRAGRVKVRVDGIHGRSVSELPTKDLPWAQPLHPITSAASEGVGYGGVGLQVGTRVLVFFRDPGQYQQPVIMGSLPGLYVGDEDSEISKSRESDLGSLATANLVEKTPQFERKSELIEVATDYVSISEPTNPYATLYPNNQTIATKSGHVIELDDTPENERIHIYHKSGTFVEIHPDGKVVYKTPTDTYEIVERDRIDYTGGSHTEYVGGSQTKETIGSVTLHIGVDKTVHIDGNSTVNIGGDAQVSVGGDCSYSTGGNFTVSAGGDFTVTAATINLN